MAQSKDGCIQQDLPALTRLAEFAKMLSVENVAVVFGVCTGTIFHWVEMRVLVKPRVQTGGTTRWASEDLKRFIKSAIAHRTAIGRGLEAERLADVRAAERAAGLLTGAECASLAGISLSTWLSWEARGFVHRSVRGTGGSRRWKEAGIEAWIAGGCEPVPKPTAAGK